MSSKSVKLVVSGGKLSGVIIPAVSGLEMSDSDAVTACDNIQAQTLTKVDGVFYVNPTPKPANKPTPKPKRSSNKSGLTVKVNYKSDADAVIKWLRNDVQLPRGARAEVVGSWVWLYVNGNRGNKHLQEQLKAAGFHYNDADDRKCYQHRGGTKRTGKARKYDPRTKYSATVALEA